MRPRTLDARHRSILLRWMLGILLAPLAGAAATLVVPGGVYAVLFGLPLSYPVWILAVPLFAWFQRRQAGVARYAAASALLGIGAWAVVIGSGGLNRTIPGFRETAGPFATVFLVLLSIAGAAIMGAITGLVFWLIAIRPAAR